MLARIAHTSKLLEITLILALSHLLQIMLHWIGRAAPPITPVHGTDGPRGWVDDWWWMSVHGLAAALLIVAVVAGHRWPIIGIVASALSFMTWLVWSLLDLAWSLDTMPPAALVAPMLGGLVVAPLSALCGLAWSERD